MSVNQHSPASSSPSASAYKQRLSLFQTSIVTNIVQDNYLYSITLYSIYSNKTSILPNRYFDSVHQIVRNANR